MSLTTRTLSSLSNGVSRQPAILRSADQTQEEVNTWGQIATGVSRRPPLRHVKSLGPLDLSGAHVHHINRDLNERYLVIIKKGLIRVFNQETGAEVPVSAPNGFGYLDQDTDAYRAVTVADYTFIVNTATSPSLYKPPANTPPGTPPPEPTTPVVDPGGTKTNIPCYKRQPDDPDYCGTSGPYLGSN